MVTVSCLNAGTQRLLLQQLYPGLCGLSELAPTTLPGHLGVA